MGKNLLLFPFLALILLPLTIWGQACPTSVSISSSEGNTICENTSVTFTANASGGTKLHYQWQINDSDTGTDSNQYNTSSLINGDKVKVIITSEDDSSCSISSNPYTMTVNASRTPTVSISSSPNTKCVDQNITFTASNTSGGSNPTYTWYVNSNSSPAQNSASNTFSLSTLPAGSNTIKVVLTSSLKCVTSATAEKTITVTVKDNASITPSGYKDKEVCINKALDPIIYTIGGSGTGATVTGLPSGVSGNYNSGSFTISGTPTQTGVFNYSVTTTGPCGQNSESGTITVNKNATINLNSGNSTQEVCQDEAIDDIIYDIGETGTDAMVTGLPSGISGSISGGLFTISGSSSQVGTHNFTIHATGTCGDSSSLNGLITINQNLTPSVSISSSETDNEICEGTTVTFTATPTNGGNSPSYQWKIDDANAGTNSATFSTNSLTNGQNVSVEMTSSETCVTQATVTSNSISTTVNDNLTPEVTIEASDSDICAGNSITFTATPINGGSSPSYQWKVNGSNAGSNSSTFTTDALTDGQSISVIMTSNETCLATPTATSNVITVNVNPNLTPSVSISSDDNNNIICSGSSITFTASATNGGASPSYQWQVNDSNVGTNRNTFTTNSLTTGQKVKVIMTSNADCLATPTAESNEISIQVDSDITGITPAFDNSDPSYNPTAVCPVVSGLIYKVQPVTGATSYSWIFPSGWNITSGDGTNMVTVTATSNAQPGTVKVTAHNECGDSSQFVSESISTGTVVYVNAGPDQTVCKGTTSIQLAGEIGGVITKSKDWSWSASVSGGTFSNGGGNLTGTYTLPSSISNSGGTITIKITSIDPAGSCGPKEDQMVITVLKDATISDPSNKNQTVCINNAIAAINFNIANAGTGASVTGLPTGVTGSFSSGVFTISGTPTQAGTFNYKVNTTGSCSSQQTSQTGTITVNPNQTINDPANKNQEICINTAISEISFTTNTSVTNVSVAGLPAGLNGNFSAGNFKIIGTPTEAGIFNYTVTTTGNCVNTTQTGTITVNPDPTINSPSNKDQEICINTALGAIAFTITSPGTGASATGLPAGISGNFSNGIFTLSGKPTESGTFDYTVTTAGSCVQATQTGQLIIKPDPTASISYTGEFCSSQAGSVNVELNGTGEYQGGNFYSSPAGLVLNATTGEIIPGSSDPGTYTVNYDTPEGCETATATTTVVINASPSVEISYGSPFCNSDNSLKAVSFTNGVGNYEGGTFSSTPGGLDLDTDSGEINPANSSLGTYTVKYTVSSGSCETFVTTTEVQITQLPQVEISYSPNTFCNSDNNDYSVIYSGTKGAYEGGTFTSTDGLAIDANGNINPSNSSVGSHTITYTVTSSNGCSEVIATTEIEIFEQVKITTQPENYGICSSEPADFEVIASGDNLKYQWYKNDGSGNFIQLNGETNPKLHFNNATSTDAGEYHVVVSSSNGICGAITSDPVTLNVDENIIITKPVEDKTICEEDFDTLSFEYEAHANGAALTFTWIKDGNPISQTSGKYTMTETGPTGTDGVYSGTLTIENITTDDSGVYAVAIDGPDYFTCPEATSKTFTFRVNARPSAPATTDLEYCLNSSAAALTATAEDGNSLLWYNKDADGNLVYLGTDITPETGEPGVTSYWVTQKNPNSCESDPAELKVTVLDKPDPVSTQTITYDFCHNEEVVDALSITPANGATINWYDAATGGNSISAPVPPTNQVKLISYWISQTFENGCESDRTKVEVNINELPNIQISVVSGSDSEICLGNSTSLQATGATSYSWKLDGIEIGTTSEITVTPNVSGEIVYQVTGTNDKGCTNTSEFTITVDPKPEGGTLEGPPSVCENNTGGSITLSGHEGTIDRWEYMDSTTSAWTALPNSAGLTTYDFSSLNLTKATTFRAVLTRGVCEEAYSAEHTVGVDPVPVGGELNFANGERVFMICENPAPGYAIDLNLTGSEGDIVAWEYHGSSTTTWNTIPNFTEPTLTGSDIETLNLSESTVFRVEIESGACTPNAYSKTAIISIIPSDIKPSPVTVNPEKVCFGEQVTLTSETGYGNSFGEFDGGNFDNSSIANFGWRVRRDGSTKDLNFDSSADNIRPDLWLRTVPHDFITANISTNSAGLTRWDSSVDNDGNKGFAIISGNNQATLETPVFGITDMDQAILTFDQAYNLTSGASIAVEISTNGGGNYTSLYTRTGPLKSGNEDKFGDGTPDTRPENKIEIDLGDYVGYTNLRIRFHFKGVRDGDVWALDEITIPDGPQDVTMEWNDYTDPDNPVYIGNSNTEMYTPTQIGWNTFEIRTKIILDSNGNTCTDVENFETISVYVYDSYTTTAAAVVGSCGDATVNLTGTLTGANQEGNLTSFPEDDASTLAWNVISGPAGYTFSPDNFQNSDTSLAAVNDPNATFLPPIDGTYTLRWEVTKDPESPDTCPVTYTDVTFDFVDCTTLDFDGVDDYVDLGTNYTGSSYSIEAWIRPEASTGTIIAGPGFEIKMNDLPSSIQTNGRWYHIAYTSSGTLYIDGISQSSNSISGVGETKTLIGARWNASTKEPENYYSGWIEEVRIWKTDLTQDQIRFMMNQHLQNAANMGVEIPMPVPGGLTYSDLAGYYRLISSNPDPLPGSPITFDAALMPQNGQTPDLATNSIPGILHNMETDQQNTAPLPYLSANDGKWTEINTWLRPDVWDIPNAKGIDNSTFIDWNIVRTFNNISSDAKNITVLGLKEETPGTVLTVANPGSAMDETNSGQFIRVTHYLLLNGNMDLVGESQLLQDEGSILDESSGGWLERDQQGRMSSFNYNYWSSPVSAQGASNNADYAVGEVLLDGTNSANPKGIDFKDGYYVADGPVTSPNITISNEWIWNFIGGTADTYGDWTYLGSDGSTPTGSGYSMKGTDGTVEIDTPQNYVFKGKPHNGDITLSIGKGQNYLIGNPYPSAIDAKQFIKDNLENVAGGQSDWNAFNGVVYFWDHFANKTHILEEYIGGYATFTLAGGTEAISVDERINANNQTGGKEPMQYIPVAQGFFINSTQDDAMTDAGITIDGGSFTFKNSQRIYATEKGDPSVFLSPEKSSKSKSNVETDSRPKIRLKYNSPSGYHRQILVTEDPLTSNNFDLGYDAPLIEDNLEDMYWLIKDYPYVIQAVGNFDQEQVLPLAIKLKEKGEFSIQIDSTENWPVKKPVYLKDKTLDTIHNIRKQAYVGTAEGGEIKDRFEIVFFKPELDNPEDLPVVDGLFDISYSTFKNQVKINNPDLLEISRVMIFDMAGKIIQQFEDIPTEMETVREMRPVRSGVYIVKVFSENAITNKKIIVK
ncbi:hypothetical protein C7S20_09810 [Christiangramia fulva]|uniref:Ig-like domain-containing protein n=1 Tax=Christiangramia fulva TaxID=2126553 RepID=A0A2R3Z5I1_9FLAO|nr:T9SS type A sorting domain-containing protein [Christiangramia fulva]AVR45537.1 hypothetical protein C7S20_09810 [Christiangramia fulva]